MRHKSFKNVFDPEHATSGFIQSHKSWNIFALWNKCHRYLQATAYLCGKCACQRAYFSLMKTKERCCWLLPQQQKLLNPLPHHDSQPKSENTRLPLFAPDSLSRAALVRCLLTATSWHTYVCMCVCVSRHFVAFAFSDISTFPHVFYLCEIAQLPYQKAKMRKKNRIPNRQWNKEDATV